jgi:hypothetical protein
MIDPQKAAAFQKGSVELTAGLPDGLFSNQKYQFG